MADAAKHALENKPDIIDINMGCPAKKVIRSDHGSALVKITRAHLLPTDQGTATSHPLLRERILALGLPLEMMAVRAGDTPTATVVGASV